MVSLARNPSIAFLLQAALGSALAQAPPQQITGAVADALYETKKLRFELVANLQVRCVQGHFRHSVLPADS